MIETRSGRANASRTNASKTNQSGKNVPGKNSRRKKKKKIGGFFSILLLLIVSVIGIFVIVYLSKNLMSKDGVVSKDTTKEFTAKIEVLDVKIPKGFDVTASEFINNVDNVDGIVATFVNKPDVNTVGKKTVDILVSSSDGSSREFRADFEVYEDTEPPVITGVTDRHFNIGDNISYLKGVVATDNMDDTVEINVDNSHIVTDAQGNVLEGNYPVIYSATDRAGNKSEDIQATFYFEANGVNDDMIDAAIDKALAGIINDDMTIEQKAYAIYNYTYDNISYTGTSTKGDYRLEAYNGLTTFQGDCYTYYSAAKAMLLKIGAKVIDVERAEGIRNDHHYWLLVDLGSGYYHFDSTRRKYYFDGFMATDEEIAVYSQQVVNGYYYIDTSLYPATPKEEFTFKPYEYAE